MCCVTLRFFLDTKGRKRDATLNINRLREAMRIELNTIINQSINGLYFKRVAHDSKETDNPCSIPL